jgi:hypothetical protein
MGITFAVAHNTLIVFLYDIQEAFLKQNISLQLMGQCSKQVLPEKPSP